MLFLFKVKMRCSVTLYGICITGGCRRNLAHELKRENLSKCDDELNSNVLICSQFGDQFITDLGELLDLLVLLKDGSFE